jgi:hypothetical protein
MLLAEITPRSSRPENDQENQGISNHELAHAVDPTFDFESWELLSCWKQQQADRFGGGNNAPEIPCSQRQYDGENSFEFCEQLAVR